jgi:hypothetical protein
MHRHSSEPNMHTILFQEQRFQRCWRRSMPRDGARTTATHYPVCTSYALLLGVWHLNRRALSKSAVVGAITCNQATPSTAPPQRIPIDLTACATWPQACQPPFHTQTICALQHPWPCDPESASGLHMYNVHNSACNVPTYLHICMFLCMTLFAPAMRQMQTPHPASQIAQHVSTSAWPASSAAVTAT